MSSLLYNAGATVWIAGRNQSTGLKAIEDIKAQSLTDAVLPGKLHYLQIELNDLRTIKPAVAKFKQTETRLDGLFNNAGTSLPPPGLVSAQGDEIVVATNCTGPYLLTTLLIPLLRETAAKSLLGSVRILWTSSQVVEGMVPKGGMDLARLDNPPAAPNPRYVASKLGNVYLAAQFAADEQVRSERQVISVALNPGNLRTGIMRNNPTLKYILDFFFHPAHMGAYTMLFAGLSPEISPENNGAYIMPWGRLHPGLDESLVQQMKSEEEHGTGKAIQFRAWLDGKIQAYV